MFKTLPLLLASLVVSTSAFAAEYPSEVKAEFIQACESHQKMDANVCQCMIEKLQSKYSLDEYNTNADKIQAKKEDPAFMTFMRESAQSCKVTTK